jgi:hypothetical protein
MTMETPRITADVIEAQEFPYLAQSFAVRAVPKTIINNAVEVLGSVPEPVLVQRILTAVGREELLAEFKQPLPSEQSSGPTTIVGG